MKRYILHIITFLATMLVTEVAWGETTWSGGYMAGTYSLTENVRISAQIKVKTGTTLTINNSSGKNISISPSQAWLDGTSTAALFKVEDGGTLIMSGTESSKIILDGLATYNENVGSETNHPFTDTFSEKTIAGHTFAEGINNTNGTMTLEYVVIQNINGSGNGGGILVEGTNSGEKRYTTISNCIIRNCKSEHGSAIHIVNVNNSSKTGSAENSRVKIEDCTLEWNYSTHTQGGTIRTNGSTLANLYLVNTVLQNNYTKGNGGGIYWNAAGSSDTKCVFDGCTFINNKANADGGAMMLESTFEFKKDGNITTIANNIAGSEGGGIYINSYKGNAFTVQDSRKYYIDYTFTDKLYIYNNRAGSGGGIYFNFDNYKLNGDFTSADANNPETLVETTININGSRIESNTASNGTGGGISINNTTSSWSGNQRTIIFNVNINGGTISNNSAKSGGGIYTKNTDINYDSANATKLIITNNKATNGNGGGILTDGGKTIKLGETDIDLNTASKSGGAIYLSSTSGTSFTTEGTTTISNNSCKENGGGVFVSGGTVTLSNPTITGNGINGTTKAKNGGAIYVTGTGAGFTAIGTSSINSNSATGNGGAVYVEGGSVTLAANAINTNTAKNGGAIYLNGGGFTAAGNTTMSSNTASGDGGAVYVSGGNIEISGPSSVLTLSSNNAVNGGAFYVNNGSIKTTGIKEATITNNYSAISGSTGGEGGAFYVSNGDIDMCKTNLSGNGKLGDSVKTTNGGAIALYNGEFSFADGSEIKNNAATKNGGGLYVWSAEPKIIKCIGGSYLANSSALGGGIYASGPIDLTIAANVRGNAAVNGGGLYLTNGVDMTFGYEDNVKGVVDGLIVDNSATATGGSGGVGGGIYVDKGILSFYLPTDKAKQKLGIYNNVATYEAADIFSSGVSTTVNLPDVGGMNLTGFDVPGSTLYWVKDVNNNRYQTALMNLNADIETMILGFGADDVVKTLTDMQCLDLGYDLVYVTLRPANLGANDNAALEISYPLDKDNPDVDNKKQYRKILLQGNKDAIVGLPSGLWNMKLTEWAVTYDQPSLTPAAGTNGFVNVTRQSLKPTDGVITVTFKVKEQFEEKEVLRYDYIKVNKMIPKVAN